MKKKLLCTALLLSATVIAACGANTAESAAPETTTEAKAQEQSAEKTEDTAAAEESQESEETEPYKIGIVTPTLTVSEDEFRGAAEMVEKYPDIVVHKTLPENFATDKEGCISVVTSLADDPEIKYILFNNGMEGIVPAFQTVR